MDVSQVRSRWLLPLFQLLDFDPVYLRGDTVLDEAGKLRYPLSHRGWDVNPPQSPLQGGSPVIHTVVPSQDLDARSRMFFIRFTPTRSQSHSRGHRPEDGTGQAVA